jgi:hypothetical protein
VEQALWCTPAEGGEGRTLWYGDSRAADLTLEIALNGRAPAAALRYARDQLLRSVELQDPEQPASIGVFGSRFAVPAGYRPVRWVLKLGDIALRCDDASSHSRLMVRQVYPAGLALQRRPPEYWLQARPFADHHRYRVDAEPAACELRTRHGSVRGLHCSGVLSLPWPLGRVTRRRVCRMACADPVVDRFLVAGLEGPGEADGALLRGCIESMGSSDDHAGRGNHDP